MNQSNKLSSLKSSRRGIGDSNLTYGLSRLDERRSNLRISHGMGSSIGMNSIVTSCLFHPGERITNFCTNKDCLLPLCPKCVKIHTEEHNKMGIFGDFNTIDESYREAEINLKGSLSKLSELESLLIKIKEDYELKVALQKKSLNEARTFCIGHIDKMFDLYEQALSDFESIQNRQFLQELYMGEHLLAQSAQDCRRSLHKIGSSQSVLEGIISYYSSADEIYRLELTQQKLMKLLPKTLDITYHVVQLDRFEPFFKKYMNVVDKNEQVWNNFRIIYKDSENKKNKHNRQLRSRSNSPLDHSKMTHTPRKTQRQKDKNILIEEEPRFEHSSIFDKFQSPLDNFSLERARKRKGEVK